MQDLEGRVAVVTGAASGIGRALAGRFAAEGMRVVLADVETDALAATADMMRTQGATILAVPTDVSQAAQVDALAAKTIEAFGAVHVLCNNAGVAGTGALCWERGLRDWQWTLGVNLWGVIHGLRAFVPRMLEQGTEGHVVNTASMAGLLSGPVTSDYGVTKHAVVTLSESLHHELALVGSRIKVSVLCPAWVNTRIMDSERNRPRELPRETQATTALPMAGEIEGMVRQFLASGLAPEQVAACVLDAIRSESFYILTHPHWKAPVRQRMENILEDRNPTFEPFV